MNNEQQKAKELAELLTAFADGKQLQYQTENLEWFGTTSLMYIADSVINNKRQIRIKPETKRVPLTMQDLIDRELSGKTISVIYNKMVSHILRFTDTHMYTSNGGIPYLFAFQHHYTFIDNSPCYKEVESE